jgi:hypothetical protein
MVTIGLAKPYANMKVGKSCICTMFIDSWMIADNGIKIKLEYFPGSE